DARWRDETFYIEDAGFTAPVIKQLPRHRVSGRSLRSFIILAATILSAVVAYFASGGGMFVHDAFARISGLQQLQLFLVIVGCGIAMTIARLWVALARRDETII